MSEPVIKLEGVWKIFGARIEEAMRAITQEGLTKAQALQRFGCVVGIADCSFEVPRGEIFCVMGLSGSGKSTMVRHVNRLIEPTAGRIEVLGRDVLALGERELRKLRAAQIGMVFQHMALFPHRTVRDNVAFPLQVQGQPKIDALGGLPALPQPRQARRLRRPLPKRAVGRHAAAGWACPGPRVGPGDPVDG